jgi:Leucine-rich repeat (LRR) protein
MKDVISSRGKYYFLRFYAKEVLEVFFQLAGVINSQTETDAFPAFFTAFFVGLNLILVPLVYNVAMQFSGPTLATGLAVFMESLFDKGFIILAVLVRSTSTTISGRNVAEKLLRHGLTLIPAISFALNKSSYITLANQYKAHTLKQNNTNHTAMLKMLKIQNKAHMLAKKEIRGFSTSLGRKSIETPAEKEQNQQRATPPKRQSSNRRQSLRQSFLDMKETNKVTFYFNKIIGMISISIGLVLTSIVSHRYTYITNHCRQKMGPIYNCATPKYYFRNGLLNGDLTCAEDQYISMNCTNGELKGIHYLQEADMYKSMKNLTSIDIANNDLVSIPTSFAYLPKLIFLNVSGNTRMSKLPYALCASSSLEKEIVLKGTQIAKELDWSGEVLNHANTEFSIHSGCLRALENTLTKLSLANNKLSATDDACLFEQVEGLRKLTYLNLRNNTITVFGMSMVQKTKHILSANTSGGISLENNPVTKISLSAMTEILVNSCMQASNSISDATRVHVVEIK